MEKQPLYRETVILQGSSILAGKPPSYRKAAILKGKQPFYREMLIIQENNNLTGKHSSYRKAAILRGNSNLTGKQPF